MFKVQDTESWEIVVVIVTGGMKIMGEVVRRGEEKWSGICVWLLVGVLILLLILVLVL